MPILPNAGGRMHGYILLDRLSLYRAEAASMALITVKPV